MRYKCLLILLLCCRSAFALDFAFNVGGAAAHLLNGGGASDAVALANISGASGSVIAAPVSVTMSNNGSGVVRLTGGFTGSEVGHIIHVTFASAYTSGRRLVTAVDGGSTWVDITDAYTSTVAVSQVRVGGAVPIIGGGTLTEWGLQEVLDDTAFGSAAANNVDIYQTGDATLTGNLVKDAGGGSATTLWHWYGCDSSYVRITPTRTVASGGSKANKLLDVTGMPNIDTDTFFVTIAVDYTHVDGIFVSGSSGDTNGLLGDTAADHQIYSNCVVSNSNVGANTRAIRTDDYGIIYNCDALCTGATGTTIGIDVSATGEIINCRAEITSNDVASCAFELDYGSIENCITYDGSGIGVRWESASFPTSVSYCTFENVLTAIELHTAGSNYSNYVIGNIAKDCTNFINNPAGTNHIVIAMYNHLNNNTTNYPADVVGVLGFQDLTSDPLFVSEANDNYNLQATSPAKNSGPFLNNRGAMSDIDAGGGGQPVMGGSILR